MRVSKIKRTRAVLKRHYLESELKGQNELLLGAKHRRPTAIFPRRSLARALVVVTALSMPFAAQAQTTPGSQKRTLSDGQLAAALANCDGQAEQQKQFELTPRSLDPTTVLSPILLLNELNTRQKLRAEQPQRLAIIEQQRRQCRQAAEAAAGRRVQEARNQVRDRDHGYRQISIETFMLDGKALAARTAKVSLRGSYIQDGNISLLFANQTAVIKATRYPQVGRNEPRIVLLTDDATRESRQYFLRCNSDPAAAQVGCPVTVLGRATMCSLANNLSGTKQTLPCLAVEKSRP